MSMNILKVQDDPPKEWQKYDLCLILPTEEDTCKIRSDAVLVIRTMAKILGRKYMYIYYSDDGMRVYVLIRAGLKLLRAKAHSEKWKLLLDEKACQQAASEGSEGEFIKAFSVPHNPQVTSIRPFEYLYAEYSAEVEVEHLYKCSRHSKHPFHKALRIKMLFDFFEKNNSTDKSLSLEKLRDSGTITEMFAIHFLRERDEIAQYMLGWRPQRIPEELLQHYFGEEITMYFSFLEHVFNWQVLPAVVGIAFQATAITFDNYSRSEIPAFSFFLIFWNITAIQSWRKKQSILGMKWNMLGSDMSTRLRDRIRYQFNGSQIKSPIDGKQTLFFPSSRRWKYFVISFFCFALILAMSIGGCGAIYYYARPRLSRTLIDPFEQWVVSGGTALQIMIANCIYYYIAVATSEWENHRLEKDFVSSLSVKLALFQIVNTLASSYYLAFAARFVPAKHQNTNALGDCFTNNCVFPVTINVVTIAGIRTVVHAMMKFILPYTRYWILFSFFGAYQDRVIGQQEAQGGDTMTVVTTTNNHDDDDGPELNAIYRANDYDSEENGSTGGETVLGRGNDQFSGISPLRSAGNNASNKHKDHNHNSRTRAAEPASDRNRSHNNNNNNSNSNNHRHRAQNHELEEEELTLDDFDEEDDLVTAIDEEAPRGTHANRRTGSVNPDMARTMSTYLQQRQRQELAELAEIANRNATQPNNNRHSRSLVRQGGDEDGDVGGHDGDNNSDSEETIGIATDPFKSYMYHNYDSIYEYVTRFNDLLGIMVLCWTFGATLPGVFALFFIWLVIEMRGQAWLLLYLYPRPVPKPAENIEPWLDIYDLCLSIGILTNASLIVFTMEQFSHWSLGYRCALWIGIVIALMAYSAGLRRYFATLPEEIVIQKQRTVFIEQKLVQRHPDVEDTLPMEML